MAGIIFNKSKKLSNYFKENKVVTSDLSEPVASPLGEPVKTDLSVEKI
jgi:hypothetical protein